MAGIKVYARIPRFTALHIVKNRQNQTSYDIAGQRFRKICEEVKCKSEFVCVCVFFLFSICNWNDLDNNLHPKANEHFKDNQIYNVQHLMVRRS